MPASSQPSSSASSGTIVSKLFCAMCWSKTTRLLNTAIIGPSATIVDSSWIDMLAGLSPCGILRTPPYFCAVAGSGLPSSNSVTAMLLANKRVISASPVPRNSVHSHNSTGTPHRNPVRKDLCRTGIGRTCLLFRATPSGWENTRASINTMPSAIPRGSFQTPRFAQRTNNCASSHHGPSSLGMLRHFTAFRCRRRAARGGLAVCFSSSARTPWPARGLPGGPSAAPPSAIARRPSARSAGGPSRRT